MTNKALHRHATQRMIQFYVSCFWNIFLLFTIRANSRKRGIVYLPCGITIFDFGNWNTRFSEAVPCFIPNHKQKIISFVHFTLYSTLFHNKLMLKKVILRSILSNQVIKRNHLPIIWSTTLSKNRNYYQISVSNFIIK